MNWQTIGNEKATGALRRALDGSRLPHALLIAGPEHVGKMSLALDLASALNCTGDEKPCGECAGCSRTRRGLHTDIHVVGLQMAAGGAREPYADRGRSGQGSPARGGPCPVRRRLQGRDIRRCRAP